ncbi:MAG: hypothetical protein WCA31_03395 [Acidimicrobiales bacterium]
MSEIGPLESFEIDIDTAESPWIFAAVTVTRERTTPPFAVEAAKAGEAKTSTSPQHTAGSQTLASDVLTLEYYQA